MRNVLLAAAALALAALVACSGAPTGASATSPSDAATDDASPTVVVAPSPPAAAWARAVPTTEPRCLSAAAFMDNRYVIVAGAYAGTLDLGLGALTSAGAGDLYVLALDADGAPAIVRTYPSARGACGGMALDGDGLISLVGGFSGDLAFGDVQLACRSGASACATEIDGYVASISLDAVAPGVRYARRLGAPAPASGGGDGSVHLTRASAGRDLAITTVGAGAGVVDLGLGALDLGATPGSAIVLVRLDSGGATLLAHAWRASGRAEATDVAVSSADSAMITGTFSGALTLATPHVTSADATAGFVVTVGGDGAVAWEHLFGDGVGVTGEATALATDLSGAAIVVGQRHDVARGEFGVFVWKGDHAGAEAWSRTIATRSADTRLGAVATDVAGNVFVGGEATEELVVDGARVASVGPRGGVVVALDPAGQLRWAGAVGGPDGEAGITQLSVTRAGALLVTGWFQGRVSAFGRPLESATRSGFVAKVVP